MSPYEILSLLVSIGTLLTVIISILPLNKSLRSSTFEAGRGHLFDFNQIFINNPDLRPYFYSGKELNEDDPNYDKVMAMAENFQDFMDSVLMQRKSFPRIWPKSWWIPYFKDIFANSPVLCRSLRSTSNWYQPELIKLMEQGEALRQKRIQQDIVK